MKNVLVTIALTILTISVSKSQNIDGDMTFNPNSKIYDILETNDIFYIGLYDRILMSKGEYGFVAGNPENLKKFDSTYKNVKFQTLPDTNHILGIWSEMSKDKFFEPNEAMVNKYFDSGRKVMGVCEYETPKSKKYNKIVIYEYITRNGQIHTSAIGENKMGVWENII
jgi:hypothetical protein